MSLKDLLGFFFKKEQPKRKKGKPERRSKRPSVRRTVKTICDDTVYSWSKLDPKKVHFKTSYTIRDFEILSAQGCYQEAYWAAHIIESGGGELDELIIENVRLAVEVHWPQILEDRKKREEELEKEKQKLEENRLIKEWLKEVNQKEN